MTAAIKRNKLDFEFMQFWIRASSGCRLRDRHTAILLSFEACEPILQTLRNVGDRIQTMSENRRVRQYHGYGKAAARRAVNTLFLRRCDGILLQIYFGGPLGLNSTRPRFFE